jgi:hypothetical protein
MSAADLDEVEARLRAVVDRYRNELVDGTIYGIPSLVWPGATGHDYFVALKRGKKHVSLYAIVADRYPEEVADSSPELRARRRGRATFAFTSLDDHLASDLGSLLDRLLVRYREEHDGA